MAQSRTLVVSVVGCRVVEPPEYSWDHFVWGALNTRLTRPAGHGCRHKRRRLHASGPHHATELKLTHQVRDRDALASKPAPHRSNSVHPEVLLPHASDLNLQLHVATVSWRQSTTVHLSRLARLSNNDGSSRSAATRSLARRVGARHFLRITRALRARRRARGRARSPAARHRATHGEARCAPSRVTPRAR